VQGAHHVFTIFLVYVCMTGEKMVMRRSGEARIKRR
jgi:hypothetical protein